MDVLMVSSRALLGIPHLLTAHSVMQKLRGGLWVIRAQRSRNSGASAHSGCSDVSVCQRRILILLSFNLDAPWGGTAAQLLIEKQPRACSGPTACARTRE